MAPPAYPSLDQLNARVCPTERSRVLGPPTAPADAGAAGPDRLAGS